MLLFALAILLFVFSCSERWMKIADVCEKIQLCEEELEAVKSYEEELTAIYEKTQDPDYLTVKMRRLGYIYPGEKVYLGFGND